MSRSLEDHCFGGGSFVVDCAIEQHRADLDGWRVHAEGTTEPGTMVFDVDEVIATTGFGTPLGDLRELGVETFYKDRLPTQTPFWESTSVPGIFFAGRSDAGSGRPAQVRLPDGLGVGRRLPLQRLRPGRRDRPPTRRRAAAAGDPAGRGRSPTCSSRRRSRARSGASSRTSRGWSASTRRRGSATRASCRSRRSSTRAGFARSRDHRRDRPGEQPPARRLRPPQRASDASTCCRPRSCTTSAPTSIAPSSRACSRVSCESPSHDWTRPEPTCAGSTPRRRRLPSSAARPVAVAEAFAPSCPPTCRRTGTGSCPSTRSRRSSSASRRWPRSRIFRSRSTSSTCSARPKKRRRSRRPPSTSARATSGCRPGSSRRKRGRSPRPAAHGRHGPMHQRSRTPTSASGRRPRMEGSAPGRGGVVRGSRSRPGMTAFQTGR